MGGEKSIMTLKKSIQILLRQNQKNYNFQRLVINTLCYLFTFKPLWRFYWLYSVIHEWSSM